MASKPSKARKREVLSLTGRITACHLDLFVTGAMSPKLDTVFDVEGVFDTPVNGVAAFVLICRKLAEGDRLGRPISGTLIRVKPRLEGSLYLDQSQFEAALAFAANGRLASCALQLDSPRYGSADIHSAILSTRIEA